MRIKTLLVLIVVAFLSGRYYHYLPFHHPITHATAVIHPTQKNNVSGIVTFTQENTGILIKADIKGLSPGKHGFHIHEYGDCSCTDALCAGDHFNPTGERHGAQSNAIRHVGDLGNLIANEQGVAHYEQLDQRITLNGPHSIIGRSVIVHEKEDDLVSQPTGDAGARLGCGVIGISK